MKLLKTLPLIALCTMAYAPKPAHAAEVLKDYYDEFEAREQLADSPALDGNGGSAVVSNVATPYVLGFEGISQYDVASVGRNFIPPDTNGAVGRTQYFEVSNGGYAVFDKATGNRLSFTSDVAFWAAAGQTGANGDTRVLYNAAASRWIAVSFGANVKDLQIAVSDSDNALGGWKSVKFEGYAGLGFGGAVADYPTLAMNGTSVMIGTNDFAPASSGGATRFQGTTLNVIPLDSLFNAGTPTVTGAAQFFNPCSSASCPADRGFALQGVNTSEAGTSIIANSLFFDDDLGFKINGLTSSSSAGATQTAITYLNQAAYQNQGPARQPSLVNPRVIDALDERVSSSVYQVNGRIYLVQTVDDVLDGLDEARVRYTVLDANTFAILDEGNIGEAGYDYYQGSIAVNEFGQVVIGYNRSGFDAATGKISFMARMFSTGVDGKLIATSDEILLKESLTDNYENGALNGGKAVGRQRWGDYSQVSVDPSNSSNFYLIGQFAREYNNAAGGHPGGTGGSRWGTWVAVLSAVPEPQTWAMMVFGFGLIGYAMRRRRYSVSFA